MMAIADAELLTVWESAQGVHPVARPVEILRAAGVEPSPERLPIGARDRRLLLLRERWFGPRYETTADCPACGLRVELTFGTPAASGGTGASQRLTHGAVDVEYRLPDTSDLLAILDCASVADARMRLAERCIMGTPAALSEETVAALAEALAAQDPDGDLRVTVDCPDCGHAWEALFDPAAQLWGDIESAALRVLRDVDALASAYGWSESEILSLSPLRRQLYLRMVTS